MDLYQTVTDRIVSMIERGAGEWRMPWHAPANGDISRPHNISGRVYRGVNFPLLWASAQAFGYASPIWATYRQWRERGAQVRGGEKSTLVVFWKRIEVQTEGEGGDTETRLIARGYAVFNVAQVDGFDPKTMATKRELSEPERIDGAERLSKAWRRWRSNTAPNPTESGPVQPHLCEKSVRSRPDRDANTLIQLASPRGFEPLLPP
jgi:antirestriction protein ArdC